MDKKGDEAKKNDNTQKSDADTRASIESFKKKLTLTDLGTDEK